METKPEVWNNKWKAPPWMKPGTRVRVFKGRNYPVGATGTVMEIKKTGHGVEADVLFDEGCGIAPCGIEGYLMRRNVSVLNLEPDPLSVG